MNKMRTAVWYSNRDVRTEERPVPTIGPDEVLVQVEACGLCGSDVMEWYRLDRAPLVLGHEIGGRIVEVGEGVGRYKTGDRVTVAHHVPCNTCKYCLSGHHTVCDTLRTTNFDPGGLAEYVRLPAINVDRGLFLLPDGVSYEEATFVEPLACVLRGLRKTGFKPGDTVLVIGSGIAGLLYVQLARAQGAGRVIASDINSYRLEMAEKLGADNVINAADDLVARLRELNDGHLADRVIVCTGAESALAGALNAVDRDGVVIFFAPTGPGFTFPFSINDVFWRNDITITTSYAASPADYQTALDLVHAGNMPLKEMITHRLPLAEAGEGFRLVAAAEDSLKVIIEPQR
ncbi:MAG: zinc-dependent dehydrogenase [Dehalococcoidales bacterium]